MTRLMGPSWLRAAQSGALRWRLAFAEATVVDHPQRCRSRRRPGQTHSPARRHQAAGFDGSRCLISIAVSSLGFAPAWLSRYSGGRGSAVLGGALQSSAAVLMM